MSEFKLYEKIGEGGMGVVYRAQQLPLRREVAIKYLLAGAADDPKAVQRFRREMETLSKLSHGNIIRIYDAGEQDGKLFIAMEYLKGTLALEQVIQKEGPMGLERAVSLIVPLLDALDMVHNQGLLHRDIKPSNILMEADGRPILMDFGLVKVSDKTALTRTGFLVGTPKYMPPEKICGLEEGVQSDLWSMGMVFYQMVTGQAAFQSPSLPELCKRIMDDPHPPVAPLRPDLPPEVDAIIARFLEKDPAKRIASAKEGMILFQSLMDETIEVDLLPPGPPPSASLTGPSWISSAVIFVTIVAIMTLLGLGIATLRREAQPAIPVQTAGEVTWTEEPDRIILEVQPGGAGTYRLEAFDRDRLAGSVTSVIQTPGTTRIVLEGLEAETSYRMVFSGAGGKKLLEREAATPSLDDAARELAIAMERFEPYRLLVKLTQQHYRLWNSEQTRKVKEPELDTLPAEWERRLAEQCEKHHLPARAATFARLRERILGSPGVQAAHKRTIRDQSFDFRELEESAELLGMKYAPIATLVESPLYGKIPKSLLEKPQGWIFPTEDADRIPQLFAGWESYAKGGKVVDQGFRERLRCVSDPRESTDFSMDGFLGSIFVTAEPLKLPPPARRSRVEVHAFVNGAASNQGLDLWISPRRASSRRGWKRVAQLRPVDESPQLLVHSLPPEILPSEPFYMLAELAYCRNWHLLGEPLDQRLEIDFLALQYDER